MQPYLIRPRIKPDESLYSHLIRSSESNMISAERMSQSLGILHSYHLRPLHHSELCTDHVISNYATRFKLPLPEVARKLATPELSNGTNSFEWHGLNLNASDLLLSPRRCPICVMEHPGLIRDQWFLGTYFICGYHLCDMQNRPVQRTLPHLPFIDDLAINFSQNIDAVFSGKDLSNQIVKLIQKDKYLLGKQLAGTPNQELAISNKLIPWPPKQLSLLGRSFR